MKTTRRRLLQGGAAILALPKLAKAETVPGGSVLWYDRPATEWTQALPIGNGRLGAMVFGGIADDHIQINEDTLWGGGPHAYVNPEAGTHLARLRDLIFKGDIGEAEHLTAKMMGRPPTLMPYQPLCNLRFHFEGQRDTTAYRRSLSLDDAISTVRYRAGNTGYRREVFVSHPDRVLVTRLSADRPGSLNFRVSLDSPQPGAVTKIIASDMLELTGRIEPRQNPDGSWTASWSEPGLAYAGLLHLRLESGTLTPDAGGLHVRGADAVTLLFGAATGFRNDHDIGADPLEMSRRCIEAAAAKTYADLRAAHVADHQSLFHRVHLDLGKGGGADQPTDVRIENFNATNDPSLVALYYQFGRYLLISCSRPGSQPANLQGIWNKDILPAWGSKWTTNINLEMNYWLAETGGLWEMQQPLWDLVDGLQAAGAQTARVHYGAAGWVLHHNTDLWRATAPVDGAWGMWPMGGVWLANQMWDHYRFSADMIFLRKRAYPAMKGAVRFVLDFLVEAPKGTRFAGYLVTNPSTSPENQYLLNGKPAYLTYAATMDIELITELFKSFADASRLLDRDADLREQAGKTLKRLPPLQIGRQGQLQEWIEDYAETEPHHRHVSHLWALYPGHGITPQHTPELAAAAKRSLELRGDDGTGWSKAWKSALWARLGDGDHAYALLRGLIAHSTLPDMFDTCPPFQIDGNFGGAAAIAEMLVQSGDGAVSLLPALPQAWPEGRVSGLRARGGITLDMAWHNHRLLHATLRSAFPQSVTVRAHGRAAVVTLTPGKAVRLGGDLRATGEKA
jgi:alpha-L-fucosidase 2